MTHLIEHLRFGIVMGQLTLSQQECEEYYDMLKEHQRNSKKAVYDFAEDVAANIGAGATFDEVVDMLVICLEENKDV